MCGRAFIEYDEKGLIKRYWHGPRIPKFKIEPDYNLPPTRSVPIVRLLDGELEIKPVVWGLVAWPPKPGEKPWASSNARADTIFDKPMFKKAILERRCIVPFSGFYEWQGPQGKKVPYAIRRKDGDIMSMGGIYTLFETKDEELYDTFAVVTTDPNSVMKPIHDRMPVILGRNDEEAWLDPKTKISTIEKLLKPCPSKWIEVHRVTKNVGNVRNNSKKLLEPCLD